MDRTTSTVLHGSVVEEEVQLTIVELSRACNTSAQQIELWVVEGVLEPSGRTPDEWRFGGRSLARMRLAMRLARDLDLNTPGVALTLDLLERIAALEARLGG